MSIVSFPPNPVNGMLFEAVQGLVYKYDSGTNCWIRIEGLEALGLATPLADGLMSKEDFKKLQGLLIPPPRTSLTSEDCGDTVFSSGVLALKSDDRSIDITSEPDTINQVNGQTVGGPTTWQLHENTVGFDFTVPIVELISKIEERGLLSRVQIQGRQGIRGKTGDPGVDKLDTGPIGPKGEDGVNSPFSGSLTTETVPLELVSQENRAIVDISTEETEDGRVLVVTRANIGNPDACPSLVIPDNFQSTLLVVLNELDSKFVRNENVLAGDCSLICRICASTLHHLDIEPILDEIFQKFLVRIDRLKSAKEELVLFWTRAMISLFNEQKAALCCALENCLSRKRNEKTRQYVETSRINAANGGFQLQISSADDDRVKIDMDNFKDCPIPVSPDQDIFEIPGGIKFDLDARVHVVDPRSGNVAQSLSTFLPAGEYVVEITRCCANFNQSVVGNQWSGRLAVLYQSRPDPSGPILTQALTFPDFGTFNTEQEAQNAYQNLTITLEHAGGDISVWLIDPDGFIENNAGGVCVTVVDLASLEDATNPSDPGIVYVYRNEVSIDTFIGRIMPFAAGVSAEDNLGLDIDSNINLVAGPVLSDFQISTFFFNGTDGLSIFFVAGNNPQFNTAGQNQNKAVTDVEFRVIITNNSVPVDVRVTKGDVTKISNSEFLANLSLNGDAAGFALGEIDASSDYSISVVPTDLGALRTWRAIGGYDLLLAEANEDGIGQGTTEIRQGGTVEIFDVSNVPEEFVGPEGLEVYSRLRQDLYIDRPIDILVVNERPIVVPDNNPMYLTTTPPEAFDPGMYPPEETSVPGTPPSVPSVPPPSVPSVPPTDIPSVPPDPKKPASSSLCEVDASSTVIPTPTSGVTVTRGSLNPPPKAAPQPIPSTTVVAQDPRIIDVTATINTNDIVNMRYIFTDGEGVKYFGSFITAPEPGSLQTGNWINVSLGPPILILSSPPEFTIAVLNTQNIEVSVVASQLTTDQRNKAESLTGVARLTFIQSILGTPIQTVADINDMVRFEIQFRKLAPAVPVVFGEIKATIGQPGLTLNYIIDDFIITQNGTPSLTNPVLIARTKRTIITGSGGDSTNEGGILYHDLVHYWGDYRGFDTGFNNGIDFNGNQFFVVNKSANTRVTQVVGNREQSAGSAAVATKFLGLTNLIDIDQKPIQATISGQYAPGGLAVDHFGVIYTVDGSDGSLISFTSVNRIDPDTNTYTTQGRTLQGTLSGDAASGGANIATPFFRKFPVGTADAKIVIGRLKMTGGEITTEVICNFDGRWYAIDGAAASQLDDAPPNAAAGVFNSPATRDDTTTERCCFGEGPIGSARPIALASFTGAVRELGDSPAGNSIAIDRAHLPQPALPVPTDLLFRLFDQTLLRQIQEQLDQEFNQFNLYSLDDSKIYLINQDNGQRTLFRDLGEQAFGLKCNPRSKDLYYITADRTGFENDYPSGTRIKRVDVDDLDTEGRPKIKTVWIRDNVDEGVVAIEFANTLPSDPTRSENALYTMLSTVTEPNAGLTVTVRVVEIAETGSAGNTVQGGSPGPDPGKVPTNGLWSGSGDGGIANNQQMSGIQGAGSSSNPVIFTKIPPGGGCQMFYKQVEWYERGWRIGACCGALVEFSGQYWLVVKRSVGTDISCGGGESVNTPCIRQYVDSGEGHPAIAWPTSPPLEDPPEPGGGGEEFLGRPSSGFVNFMKDEALSDSLISIIQSGGAAMTIGDPGTQIPFILFPSTE